MVFAVFVVGAIGLVAGGVSTVTGTFNNPKPGEVADADPSAEPKHDPKPEVKPEPGPQLEPEPNPEPKVNPPVDKTNSPPLRTNPKNDPADFPDVPARSVDFPDQPGNPLAPNPEPAKPPTVKLTFPTPRAVEIKPAPLDRDATEVKLGGTVTDAVIGGGGRYWCLLLSDQKQIAIFDVNQAKVVKSIPLAGGNVLVAAGMNKLLVVYPHLEVIVRYDLGTFEKEVTAKLKLRGAVKQICLGSASGGPMLVYAVKKYDLVNSPISLLDIQSFKESESGKDDAHHFWGFERALNFRASPDGRLYGAWTSGVSPTGLYGLVVSETGLQIRHEHESAGSVVPSSDGHLVTQLGVFTSELKPVGGVKDREKERFKNWTSGVRVPAHQGDWYLTIDPEKSNDPTWPPIDKRATKVTVHRTGEAQAIMTLGDIGITVSSDEWLRTNLTRDKRILFSPAGGLIAWLGPDNDKLHLRKFDAQAQLDKTGVDYLLVTSTPPSVEPEKPYKYAVAVKSKKGDVKFKLSAGPEGMKVAADGTLTWAPPKDWKGGDGVILTISDKSGQEVFHTFKLTKAGPPAKDDPPVAVKPVPNPEPDPPVKAPAEPKPGLIRLPANPAKITPTKAADKAVVKLPGTVDATCLGGNGRYVLLRIPKLKQVAVLDVCAGKIVKYIALTEEAALFAAGNEHLFVVAPKANTIQRWNLTTFEKEDPVANPIDTPPRQALVGHATDGPLFLIGAGREAVGLLDGKTLKKLDVRGGWKDPGWYPYVTQVRISADGCVLGHWNPGYTPSGLRALVLSDEGVKSYDEHESVGAVLPGPDGTLFTSAGLYAPDLKPIHDKTGHWEALPPAHGRVYLAVCGIL